MEKYDRIGIGYNQTRKADPYLVERLFSILNPTKEAHYLDIGCGTGNYTSALFQGGMQLTGMDPSEEMLQKARMAYPYISWKKGNAAQTGLKDASFDGVIATLTIHHWPNLDSAFTEIRRILKPASQILIFTSTPKQMRGYWLKHYFPQMMHDSMKQMPSLESVERAMNKAGIQLSYTEAYDVKVDLQDLFLYCGKDRPELYLNEQVRRGISSFSDLAYKEEVKKGLNLLAADIDDGKIQKVMQDYQHEEGDYLFVLGKTKDAYI